MICDADQHVFKFPKASPHGFTPSWAFADIYLACKVCGVNVPASKRFNANYLENLPDGTRITPPGVSWGTAVYAGSSATHTTYEY